MTLYVGFSDDLIADFWTQNLCEYFHLCSTKDIIEQNTWFGNFQNVAYNVDNLITCSFLNGHEKVIESIEETTMFIEIR